MRQILFDIQWSIPYAPAIKKRVLIISSDDRKMKLRAGSIVMPTFLKLKK